jgi:hypothetical protein
MGSGCFAPEELGLSDDLTAALRAWAESYEGSIALDDPVVSLWGAEQNAAHEAEGLRLGVLLKRERPDLTVFVHTREVGVVEVHADDPV